MRMSGCSAGQGCKLITEKRNVFMVRSSGVKRQERGLTVTLVLNQGPFEDHFHTH